MSLRLPSEIVVERFLPTIRVLLARELTDHGLTQQEVADLLGVTQAAVSKYRSGGVDVEERFAEDPRMQATVEHLGEGLASGDLDPYEALADVLSLVREFEDRGPICAVHEEEMPALSGLGCDLCVRGFDTDVHAEREALATVREAARQLESTPGMAGYVPNVGTNVGTALPGAQDATDVAAIPGRIYAVRGRVEVPANPEFGASEHVAHTLLAAMAVEPEVRGALDLSTDDDLLAAADERGIDTLEFDADYENRRGRLRELFEERGAVPRVLFHRGAFGIEPVTYVLGATAVEAATLATDLVQSVEG